MQIDPLFCSFWLVVPTVMQATFEGGNLPLQRFSDHRRSGLRLTVFSAQAAKLDGNIANARVKHLIKFVRNKRNRGERFEFFYFLKRNVSHI